jgi:adenylate kinase family enzyme
LRQAAARKEPDDIVSREDIEFLRHVLRTGALLEDEQFPLAARILRSFLTRRRVDETTWVVLNGLPRHAGQAVAISEILDVRTVVCLRCAPETVLARIQADTGGDRSGRTDDDLAAIRRKLTVFTERTQPLLDFYRRRNASVLFIDVTSTMTAGEMCDCLQKDWPH